MAVLKPSECINLDFGYFDHRKVKLIVKLLGKGADVLPIRLWCYCGINHPESGRLAGYTKKTIEACCGWWGRPGEMVDVMMSAPIRLIERIDGEYTVHQWTEWQGHIHALKVRAKINNEKRWEKLRGNAASNPTSNAASNALAVLNCAVPLKPPRGRSFKDLKREAKDRVKEAIRNGQP